MSDKTNPVSDFDIVLSVFPMDKTVLKGLDKGTFDGLLKTARKKLEKDAEGAVLTPIMDALKSADVKIPAGFRVLVDQNKDGEFTVSLRKRKTGSGKGTRGKSIRFTKYPAKLKSVLANKTFPSGKAAYDAIHKSDPEKYPMPDSQFSAPDKIRALGFEFDTIDKKDVEKAETADKASKRSSRKSGK